MKNRLKNNFTIVDNSVLNSLDLSLGAKGLYAFLNSKPDGWDFSYRGLSSQLKETERVLAKFVKELVLANVLLRIPTTSYRNGKAYPDFDWILHPTNADMADNIDPSILKAGGTHFGTTKTGTTKKRTTEVILKENNTKKKKEEEEKMNFINLLRIRFCGADYPLIVDKTSYYFSSEGLLCLSSNSKKVTTSKAKALYTHFYKNEKQILKYFNIRKIQLEGK